MPSIPHEQQSQPQQQAVQQPSSLQAFGPEALDRINSGDWGGIQGILQWDRMFETYLGSGADNMF